MQCELLKRISVCLPFIADLAHAQVSLLAAARQPAGRFVVLAHEKPHTVFHPAEFAAPGTLVAQVEEPLAARTLHTGKPLKGKREWELGNTSLDMYTFAIHDGAEVIAVVSIETDSANLRLDGYTQLLETARRDGNEIMVFVGNRGCVQIFTGVVEKLAPINARFVALKDDHAALDAILARGAEKARDLAKPTLDATYDALGLCR